MIHSTRLGRKYRRGFRGKLALGALNKPRSSSDGELASRPPRDHLTENIPNLPFAPGSHREKKLARNAAIPDINRHNKDDS